MNKEKEIYVGNGKTIYVKDSETTVFYLDLEKLGKIIEENPDVEIYAGATNDWFWTAQKITKEILDDVRKAKSFHGLLLASSWARFSVEIAGESQDCTVEIPKTFDDLAFLNGYTRGLNKVDLWLPGVFYDCIQNMKYEDLKKFQEEINPIITKYKELCQNTKN